MEFHPRSTQSELFELLDRLQSARLDDQRCELPTSGKQTGGKIRESDSRQNSSKQMLQRILKHPPPYPMVALTNQCAYWTEPNSEHNSSSVTKPLVTCGPTHEEDSAKMYRLHFCGYEHYNFCANITSDHPTNNLVSSTEAGGGHGGNHHQHQQPSSSSSSQLVSDRVQNLQVQIESRSSPGIKTSESRLGQSKFLFSKSGTGSGYRNHQKIC